MLQKKFQKFSKSLLLNYSCWMHEVFRDCFLIQDVFNFKSWRSTVAYFPIYNCWKLIKKKLFCALDFYCTSPPDLSHFLVLLGLKFFYLFNYSATKWKNKLSDRHLVLLHIHELFTPQQAINGKLCISGPSILEVKNILYNTTIPENFMYPASII